MGNIPIRRFKPTAIECAEICSTQILEQMEEIQAQQRQIQHDIYTQQLEEMNRAQRKVICAGIANEIYEEESAVSKSKWICLNAGLHCSCSTTI
jgi:hypothetical protein